MSSSSSESSGGLLGLIDTVARNRVAQLSSALGVSVLGVEFLSDPQGFVIASILEWAVGGVLAVVGHYAGLVLGLWTTFVGILAETGSAAVDPFGAVGDVLEEVVSSVGSLVVDIAASAGPFAPLVAIGLWAGVAVVGVLVATGAWRLYRWIRTVIV